MKKRRGWEQWLLPIAVAAVPMVGATRSVVDDGWYDSLVLPMTAPPGAVIGIVWSVLYVLIAISLVLAWRTVKKKRRGLVTALFTINLIANAAWSPIFFIEQSIGLAIHVAAIIALTAWLLVYELRGSSKTASWLLVPYALWTTFATYLSAHIWVLNL